MSTALVTIDCNKITFTIGGHFSEIEVVAGKCFISNYTEADKKFSTPIVQKRVLGYVDCVSLDMFISTHLYNLILLSMGKDDCGFMDSYFADPEDFDMP